MTECLQVERRAGYAIVRLNRPEARNAISTALREAFLQAFDELDRDDAVRAVILTGAGSAFCAGVDLKELREKGPAGFGAGGDNPVRALERFRKPVIAAVNGAAFTGGLELVLACDVVLAARSARFADTHVKVGVLPGWGMSQRLGRVIGMARAKELSLTGRPLSAGDAERWGLVNRVLPDEALMADAEDMAAAMAEMPPATLIAMKALMEDGARLPFGQALRYEIEQALAFNTAAAVPLRTAR